MKKKSKRLLLLVSLVFVCFFLMGCTKNTDVSDVEAIINERTVTISSPNDNAFRLNLEINTNSAISYWTSDNLFVSGNTSHSYNLEDLLGNYISEDSIITSVDILSAEIVDTYLICLIIAIIAFVLGVIFSFFALERL